MTRPTTDARIVEIVASIDLAGALKRAGLDGKFEHSGQLYDCHFNGRVPNAGTYVPLGEAHLHVVICDSMSWMPEHFIRSMLNGNPSPGHSRIQRLLVVGWLPSDDHDSEGRAAIRAQRWLRLLFDAFEPKYAQLPMSIPQFKGAIVVAACDKERREHWTRDWHRVLVALGDLCASPTPGSSLLADAWRSLDELAGGGTAGRLRYEHDVMRSNSDADRFMAIYDYQTKLDHYYLCGSRARPGEKRRRLLIIDDHPEYVQERLQRLADATCDELLIASDWDGCLRALVPGTGRPRLNGKCKRLVQDTKEPVTVDIPGLERLDGVLVDLLFEGKQSGLEAIRVLGERCPEIPSWLLTWSEEPDVMAEVMRDSDACGFVSKRRLLRLPHELDHFLYDEISPLLPCLADREIKGSLMLRRRLIGLIRLWKAYPAILWHGEKTFHAAEHAIEHHLSLWRLANMLLAETWQDVTRHSYGAPDLFRFLIALWLHDIGCKGDSEYQHAPRVRACHAPLGGRLIRANWKLYGLQSPEVEDIALLCEFHQSGTPFIKSSDVKPEMRKFFHHRKPLCEAHPRLAPWAALLRILDQIDNQWRRVGGDPVYRSKKATLRNDQRFYDRYNRNPESAYADWLGKQSEHLTKHRAVSAVTLHITHAPADTLGREGDPIQWFFWPGYTYRDPKAARRWHYGRNGIAMYVLKEWAQTGQFVERLGISLPLYAPPKQVGPEVRWVWNDNDHFRKQEEGAE
jgi:hypothetical protein